MSLTSTSFVHPGHHLDVSFLQKVSLTPLSGCIKGLCSMLPVAIFVLHSFVSITSPLEQQQHSFINHSIPSAQYSALYKGHTQKMFVKLMKEQINECQDTLCRVKIWNRQSPTIFTLKPNFIEKIVSYIFFTKHHTNGPNV